LNERNRNVVEHLDELHKQVGERLAHDETNQRAVSAHVDELRTLVQSHPKRSDEARVSASTLERKLLAWEAEHPQLVALATRIARALEDSGL
jgi:hypothetical protein